MILLFTALFVNAQNAVNFNSTSDLTTLFNPNATHGWTNISTGGIGNTGSIDVPSSSLDIWTNKTGYSVSGAGDVYTISAYFLNADNSGYGGLGFTTVNQNESDTYGSPLYGLGMGFHGGGGFFINNQAQTSVIWGGGNLTIGNWYQMILKVTAKGSNLYDMDFQIWNSDANGTIGSLRAEQTLNNVTNTNVGAAGTLYAYLSASGNRVTKIDNFDFSYTPPFSSAATDYFRSVASGNWSNTSTWQSSPDNSTWGAATLAPTSAATRITIQSPNTVTIDVDGQTASAIVIESGATLTNSVTNTLQVSGDWTNNGGTFNGGIGTVNFNGTSQQHIGGSSVTTFYNLTLNNSVYVELNHAITINGTLSINTTFYDGGNQITCTGTLLLNSGEFMLGSGASATTWPGFTNITINTGPWVSYAAGVAQTVATTYNTNVPIPYHYLVFEYAGTKTTASGTLTISHLWNVISTTNLSTNSTSVNLTGALSGTGSITSGSGTINIGGNWTNNGTFTCGTGTVNYNGGAQTIGNVTYNNLTLSGSGNKTFSAAEVISGTLAISGTAKAALTTGTNTTAGYLTLGGASEPSGTWGSTAAGKTHINDTYFTSSTGYVTVASGCTAGTWSGTSGTDWNDATNWCGGIPDATTNVDIPSGGNQPSIGAAGGLCRNITIESGATLTNSGTNTLNVSGNWTNNGGTFTCGTGTVNFNGTTTQTIGGASGTTFNNLSLNNSIGVDLYSATTINGTLSMNCNFFDNGNQISCTGTLQLNSGGFYLGSATSATTWPGFTNITINPGTWVGYYAGVAQTVATTYNTNVSIPYKLLAFVHTGTKTTASGTLIISQNWLVASTTNLSTNSTDVNLGGELSGTGSITSGSGTISITGNWTNNGTFTCGTGTVNYNGGAQNIGNVTYNNLTLSGSGNKTFSAAGVISGTLSINGTAKAALTAGTNTTAGYLTLGGASEPSGTWGSTAAGKTHINDTYFTSSTGYVTVASGCTAGTWSGTSSTDWNDATNWCGGIPTATTDVDIPSGGNQPSIEAAGGLCRNITIESGATLAITGTNNLTVSGTLTNNGTLNLLSDASGTATILTPGTVGGSGTTNVNQYIIYRTWYMSSPVASASPTGMAAIRSYDEATNLWSAATLPMVIGRGYSVTPPNDGTTNILFTGRTLNTGEKTIALTKNGSTSQAGFNSVGNPYPSYIDWKAVVTKNTVILETGTMWYRSKETGSFKFYTVDASGVVVPSGSTATAYIPPMQAFWVKTNTDGSTLYFEDNMRSHAAGTNPLKAPAAKNSELPLLRLQVSNGINVDEAVIYSYANATNGYDFYDSPKMMNNDAAIPEIYTTLNNQPIVINVMNSIPLDTEIGLGFVAGNATSFSMRANEISNLPSDVNVILKDYGNNGIETDLTDGVTTYEFSPATTTGDRFSIIFRTTGAVTGIPTAANDQNLLVYRNANNQIVVQIKGQLNDSYALDVYNSTGQKLASKQATAGITIMDAPQSGVYFVTVKGNGNNTTKKVVIN
jgi:hypothetical protein